jgi:hypothetical protein
MGNGNRDGAAMARARRRWAAPVATAAAVCLLLAALCSALAAVGPARAGHHGSGVAPGFDRVYKVQLLERLPSPPELVVYGGSRAQRFEPSYIERVTGLPAFNFAVQNSRPEDVYAMSRLLFWREPGVRLRCIWALQASTLTDSPLHPGLLAERELTQFLPEYFIHRQRRISQPTGGRVLQSWDEFSARGALLHNAYDMRVADGVPIATRLSFYLSRVLPKASAPMSYEQTRAKEYLGRTLQLFNLHDVEPVLVIMPYHPEVLAAFRAAGWDAKERAFKTYLDRLRGRYRFKLVDYTDIAAFHGDPDEFYDGAHITAVNARRILAQIVRDDPVAFR